ncbi:MAG: hypothetical protein Q7T89_12535 [Anaerolineales bacterium]|nr:hypothetical protein [Anaerolineales bacterium]
MWKKYLQRIILAVIAVLGVKTGITSFTSNIEVHSNDTSVAIWDERLSNLIAPIPFERGLVGYISNEDIPGIAFDEDDAEGEYILTQYAVAPLILVRGTDQEWNLLNLDTTAYETWHQTNINDFELVGFGGGLYLVRKVDK